MIFMSLQDAQASRPLDPAKPRPTGHSLTIYIHTETPAQTTQGL